MEFQIVFKCFVYVPEEAFNIARNPTLDLYWRVWHFPSSGASIPPETMMHFPPCFRFPPIFEKLLKFYLLPKNLLIFIR